LVSWCHPTPSGGRGVEKLHGDPTNGPDPKVKGEKSGARDG